MLEFEPKALCVASVGGEGQQVGVVVGVLS